MSSLTDDAIAAWMAWQAEQEAASRRAAEATVAAARSALGAVLDNGNGPRRKAKALTVAGTRLSRDADLVVFTDGAVHLAVSRPRSDADWSVWLTEPAGGGVDGWASGPAVGSLHELGRLLAAPDADQEPGTTKWREVPV